MRVPSLLVLAPFVALAFSGCVVGPSDALPSEPDRPAAAPTDTTGAIAGLVMDEEHQPLADAAVVLLELDRFGRSDADGSFVFNDLLEGSYRVVAERIGYGTVAQSLQVRAGMVTDVTIQLVPLPYGSEPFVAAWAEEGLIACSFNPTWPMNPCAWWGTGDRSRIPFQIEASPPMGEVLLELVWEPATPATGQELELDVCDEQPATGNQLNCYNFDHYRTWESGPSPVVLRLADLPVRGVDRYEADVGAGFPVETVPPRWGSLTPAYQQPFTLYVAYCFVEGCPEGYTGQPP